MMFSGWGRYPIIAGELTTPRSIQSFAQHIAQDHILVARGNGRSYGDSALASSMISTLACDHFTSFDETTGLLTCESGVLLSDIFAAFLPRGWFLSVTPGTKLITVGGAIASDVHGKNHHNMGCFSACVECFDLLLADSSVVTCSRSQNSKLFHATCGGMGLTGVVLTASFYLKRVTSSHIQQTTIKTHNLAETLVAFERYAHETYSVAWIDCLAQGEQLGRSLLMVGDFAQDNDYVYESKTGPTVPFDFPSIALNRWSVKAFNALYYGKATEGISQQQVSVDQFFYPLDAIGQWNRIYGKQGFVQYQFILPKANSEQGLTEILQRITHSGMGSFLAVLKLYGAQNDNWLSFPLEGYSLALDFKIQEGLFALLDELDQLVLRYSGRIYLAKDARMSQAVFEQGYPKVEAFRQLRQDLGADKVFQSHQSQRLGL
ncbi:MAG: FAD-binding oxidoreductase [Proteobacteria bacterium]|nr:FAD-binding oxidoreductase [Pseudomonadota bacterium]